MELLTKMSQANEAIKFMPIKGKNYAKASERIKAFRKVYPSGTITTEIIHNDNDIVIVCAEILNDQGELIATGHAFEAKNSSMINKTSWLENCETSAVARALGMAGFGIEGEVASAEEMTGAEEEQDRIRTEEIRKQKIGPVRAMALESELTKAGINIAALMGHCGVKNLADLNEAQHREVVKLINQKEKEAKKGAKK